jgi:DNA-binding PadR family transcriptional regulator
MNPEESPEIKRLEKKLGVELLWVFVLSILKKESCHAYVLRKKIEHEFGFLPGNVSAYVVLYKLENRNFVKTKPEGNKVVYSITDSGKKLLELAKKRLSEKTASLN